jgi:hypothetical protein
MTSYKLHNTDCSIVEYGIEVSHYMLLPPTPEGFWWTEVPTPSEYWTIDIVDDVYVAVPYVPPMDVMISDTRSILKERLKTKRDEIEWSGCATPVGQSDSTPDSQRKITGAVTMALIASTAGAPFSIDWTMADNSSATLDASGMITLGVAVGRYVSACHDRGATLKAEIDAATTIEELTSIDIDTGWPT